MKRIFILPVTLFCALACSSQVKLQAFAGPLTSSAFYTVKGCKQPTDYKLGFQLGAGCKIPFDNRLWFTPAISYKLLGYKVSFNQPSFPPDLLATDNNTSLNDVDVEVLLQFDFGKGQGRFDFGKSKGHFFLKAGPAFSFILTGKESYNLQTGDHVDRSMTFSVLNSYNRYNTAVVIQPGYETSNGFIISANYTQYLFSMNNEDQGPTIKNYMFGLTVGKLFGGKK
jgi:hypothetical protein